MSCCDYKCNQGRNCPVRAVKVEPVKTSKPRLKWRLTIKDAYWHGLTAVLIIIAALQLSAIGYLFYLAYFAFRE